MKIEYLSLFCCPKCQSESLVVNSTSSNIQPEERIKEGEIDCQECNASYPIWNYIPRFSVSTPYADSFGPQWKTFAKSQIDTPKNCESQIRFDSEIGWQSSDFEGKNVIEFGSGAGRFIDICSRRNAALVVGLDATDAVDAAQETLCDRENVLFVQADIFSAPFKNESFDFGYSIGVLHHTPNPEEGFELLTRLVKPEGAVGISLYEVSNYIRPNRNTLKVVSIELLWALNFWRCEFFRSVTTKLPRKLFLTYCKTVVPVLHYLNQIPILRYLRYLLPSTCYRHLPVIWSMVDTHDTYATKIVHQYRGKDVFQWFLHLGCKDIILKNGRAGWVSITGTVVDEEEKKNRQQYLEQPAAPGLV
jgi:SAM-dependent methyltransferase